MERGETPSKAKEPGARIQELGVRRREDADLIGPIDERRRRLS
jgi:hypothetical protein